MERKERKCIKMGIYEDIERIMKRTVRCDDVQELRDLVLYVGEQYMNLHKIACDIMNLNEEVQQNSMDKLIEENQGLKEEIDNEYQKNQRYKETFEEIQKIAAASEDSQLKYYIQEQFEYLEG